MLHYEAQTERVKRNLVRIRRGLDDFRPFFDTSGREILQSELERVFRSRGYGEWASLSASTLRDKTRRGYPADPLVATGSLRRSVTALDGLRRTRFTLSMSYQVPYARFHETGTARMPARPIFGSVVRHSRSRFVEALNRYISRKVINVRA